MKLREQICKLGAELLGCPADAVEFDGKKCLKRRPGNEKDPVRDRLCVSVRPYGPLEATETHTSPLSPPPFMVGAARWKWIPKPAR